MGFINILTGICLILYIKWVQGQCDIINCLQNGANPMFTTCSEYIRTLDCMRGQYNGCTGQAGRSEIMLSVRALSQPSDCGLDVRTMASSMSARSSMVTSMMKRSPAGAFPPGVMSFTMPANPFLMPPNGTTGGFGLGAAAGMMPMFPMMGDDMGEMDMEFPEADEGISEMWEDMMESGMMAMPGMMFPGMMGGAVGGAEGMEGMSPFPGSSMPGMMPGGKGRGPSKSRFVYYGNTAANTKVLAIQMIWPVLAVMSLIFL